MLDAENADGVDGQVNLYLRDLAGRLDPHGERDDDRRAGGGVDLQSFDIDQTGNRAVFVTSAKLDPVADTDTGFDAYVRFFIGSDVSGSTQLISPGASPRAWRSSDSIFVAFTNFTRAFLTQCMLACAQRPDRPAQGRRLQRDRGINEVFFAPDSGQTTARVYMRTSQPLDPADTDGELDLYGREMALHRIPGCTWRRARSTSGSSPPTRRMQPVSW